MVFELVAQGAGVTLVDSTSLNEVAYLCADTLVQRSVLTSWYPCYLVIVVVSYLFHNQPLRTEAKLRVAYSNEILMGDGELAEFNDDQVWRYIS